MYGEIRETGMMRSKVRACGHSRRKVQEKANIIECLMDLTIMRLLEGEESTGS